MQDDTIASATPPPRQGWRRFAAILGLFIVLGPLLGAVGVVLVFVAMAVLTEVMQGRADAVPVPVVLGRGFLITLLAGLPIAYTFGAVSSVAVGLVVALRDRWHCNISWRAALVAGGIVWLVMAAFAALVIPPDGILTWLVGLLVAHVVAAVLCTLLARLLLGPGRSAP